MGVEENKAAVRAAFDGTGEGGLVGILHEDVEWKIWGDTMFSGVFKGKEDLQTRLWGKLFENLSEMGSNHLDLVIGEGDVVVVQLHAEGRLAKSGKPYDNSYCIVFHMRDGKVAKADEYMDTQLIDTAFGPVSAASA
jgi:ketosteroid isomerase-like protein